MKKTIRILHLYPREMNIYGDLGNVLTLQRRLQWHGYDVEIISHNPGGAFPENVDIVVGGGGQDSGQSVVQDDLLHIGEKLHILADHDTPMLMICGLYQLFGKYFLTQDGVKIPGIEIFKMKTEAGPTRMIGNIVTETPFGDLLGYENHSGVTTLDNGQAALGTVKKGAGNNGHDKTEGAIYKCVFGSYLHGSLLPKNPVLADALIEAAVIKKFGSFEPAIIDDRFAGLARKFAQKRPR